MISAYPISAVMKAGLELLVDGEDMPACSASLQLASSQLPTIDKKVGFLHMHVKSLILLQLALAAAEYTQGC